MHVRLGADKNGKIRAMDVYTLSNTGAYSEHGPTTVGLSGHKSIPLYTGNVWKHSALPTMWSTPICRPPVLTGATVPPRASLRWKAPSMNWPTGWASTPVKLREQNMVREGMIMPAYYNEPANACALDRCLARCKEMIDWDAKFPVRDMGNGKVRAAGVAMAMQGSGISGVDVGSATVKLSDDGFYNLIIGAADMGTGCDTILAQMVAECMDCDLDNVAVFGADTDASPYDSGSYASTTTYVTGKAVEKACEQLKEQLCKLAADTMGCEPEEVEFTGKAVRRCDGSAEMSLADLAIRSQCCQQHGGAGYCHPFLAGIATALYGGHGGDRTG